MDFLRSWIGMLIGVGLRNVLIVRLVRSLLSMLFLSLHGTIPKNKILDYIKQGLTLEGFKASNHNCMFDKAVFCVCEKQGMLINDECSSWYYGVGNF